MLEKTILDLVSKYLGRGEKIYIEYINDHEIMYQLDRDFPIPVSRLGYKLFLRGFTWFKNWYFPEGFMEGNPKLGGEKPLNKDYLNKHLRSILKDVEIFLGHESSLREVNKYVEKAVIRVKHTLSYVKT